MAHIVFSTNPPPLHAACGIGDYHTVKLLLQTGSSPLIVDEYNLSPLHYACSFFADVCI
jgi:ankyrin repeat protein